MIKVSSQETEIETIINVVIINRNNAREHANSYIQYGNTKLSANTIKNHAHIDTTIENTCISK